MWSGCARRITTFFNLEIAATDEMVALAVRVRPDAVTLVPERREERTTEGGLDLTSDRAKFERTCARLLGAGIKTSLFIAADPQQIDLARALGAAQIELHTGDYCHAAGKKRQGELARLTEGAQRAHALGLEVAAGHGLTRSNVLEVAAIPSSGRAEHRPCGRGRRDFRRPR